MFTRDQSNFLLLSRQFHANEEVTLTQPGIIRNDFCIEIASLHDKHRLIRHIFRRKRYLYHVSAKRANSHLKCQVPDEHTNSNVSATNTQMLEQTKSVRFVDCYKFSRQSRDQIKIRHSSAQYLPNFKLNIYFLNGKTHRLACSWRLQRSRFRCTDYMN